MKKKKILLYTTISLLFVSIIYTIIVINVGVQAIGPNGTKVGLAGINGYIHNKIGLNMFWYKLTKYLEVLPFLIILFYGCIGLKQLINGKSLKKVDKRLIILGIYYVLVGVTYVLFEKIIINYRPVLLKGELEASYPSSHTMLAITVCFSSLLLSKYYIKNKKTRTICNNATTILMIALVIGRLLSGVHWFTDIVGGIIISAFLVSILNLCLYSLEEKNKRKV